MARQQEMACVLQRAGELLGQPDSLVEFTDGQQPGVARELSIGDFELNRTRPQKWKCKLADRL
jgi:hypothetical protein